MVNNIPPLMIWILKLSCFLHNNGTPNPHGFLKGYVYAISILHDTDI